MGTGISIEPVQEDQNIVEVQRHHRRRHRRRRRRRRSLPDSVSSHSESEKSFGGLSSIESDDTESQFRKTALDEENEREESDLMADVSGVRSTQRSRRFMRMASRQRRPQPSPFPLSVPGGEVFSESDSDSEPSTFFMVDGFGDGGCVSGGEEDVFIPSDAPSPTAHLESVTKARGPWMESSCSSLSPAFRSTVLVLFGPKVHSHVFGGPRVISWVYTSMCSRSDNQPEDVLTMCALSEPEFATVVPLLEGVGTAHAEAMTTSRFYPALVAFRTLQKRNASLLYMEGIVRSKHDSMIPCSTAWLWDPHKSHVLDPSFLSGTCSYSWHPESGLEYIGRPVAESDLDSVCMTQKRLAHGIVACM